MTSREKHLRRQQLFTDQDCFVGLAINVKERLRVALGKQVRNMNLNYSKSEGYRVSLEFDEHKTSEKEIRHYLEYWIQQDVWCIEQKITLEDFVIQPYINDLASPVALA
jgi:hypothetical protein